MSQKISTRYWLLLLSGMLLCSSCLKNKFDQPPDTRDEDPNLSVTHTIAALKKLPHGVALKDDIIIKGIVVMNDKSGNYYHEIVLQDSTGGIAVKIDQNALYNDYPVGRRVYVNCRGLYIAADHENPVLGSVLNAAGQVSPIPFLLTQEHLFKGSYPHPYKIDTLTIADLESPNAAIRHLNTMVALKDVAFAVGSAGVSYAQPPNMSSVTRLAVVDCSGAVISLATSGYASFRSMTSPVGMGVLVALYTRYDNQSRLYIRDTSDVWFYGPRCDGAPLTPPVAIRIDSLRRFYNGHEVVLPSVSISGVVISDRLNGNVATGVVVLQGGNNDRGILLDYGSAQTLALGDSINVNVTGCVLNRTLSGALVVSGVRMDKTEQLAIDRRIVPRDVTIATLLTHKEAYESTLVRLSQIYWEGAPLSYFGINGKTQLSDGTGTVTHYCSEAASFKNFPVPAAPVQSVTGYFEIHGLYGQIRIRYPDAPVFDVVP